MADERLDVEAVFNAARQKPLQEQAAYLDQACDDDPALRRRVEQLLAAQAEMGSFLGSPAPELDATRDLPGVTEGPGTVIGPYRLLQQIGEGGFGTVFMAEQTHPVQRRVALKVIKAGMDSRQVIARFEAERQALAMMDHVNIARVLDAGTTDSGLPYFVMELVHGVPITKYCDDNQLTPRERLELFVPVCQAIQHAHQKGIIHRDVKPSNVLVTLYDGRPVPKVIDFGVAKATEQRLTERTLFTQYGTMVGTLEYMSPEQAEMSALGVDTRSDIFSLGVLLYELLTGSTPLSHKRIREAAYGEVLRMIREEEAPKPSTRLSDSGEALASISANRHMEPAKLTKLVRGELDWIVMKTLEKDRNRRYETAKDFAADVQRYLDDETVQACPPSVGYRFRKFARRNKRALMAAGLVLVALVLSAGGIGWAVRDRTAREAEQARARGTRQAKITEQVEQILGEVERLKSGQQWSEALAAAKRADAALASGEADEDTRRRVRDVLGDLEFVALLDAIRDERFNRIGDRSFDLAGPVRAYEGAFREYGVDLERLPAAAVIDRLKARTALALPLTVALYDWVGARQAAFGANEPGWKPLVEIARGLESDPLRHRLWDSLGEPVTPELQVELRRLADAVVVRSQTPSTLTLLGHALDRARLTDVALRVMQEGQYAHPRDYWLNAQLARLLDQGGDAAAIRYLSVAVSLRPDAQTVHYGLALDLLRYGKPADAAACFRRCIELDPTVAAAYYGLGTALRSLKKPEEAVPFFQKAIELNPKSGIFQNGLGTALVDLKKEDEGIACFRKAIELNPKYPDAYNWLAQALVKQKRYEEAIATRREAARAFPKDARVLTNLATTLAWMEGTLAERIKLYREAIVLDGNHAPAHYGLSRALFFDGQLDEALAECREAIRLHEPDPFVHGHLGRVLEKKGLLAEAAAAHREVTRLRPDFAPAHQSVGDLLLKLHRAEDAVAAYREAVRLDPSPARFKTLAAACDQVVGENPEDHQGRTLAAASYAAAGDVEGYRRACRDLLAKFGDTKQALLAADVARSCLLLPDALAAAESERVRKLAERAVTGTEKDSGFRSFALSRGLSEVRAGRAREAVEWLHRSSPRSAGGPEDAASFAVLALAHHRLNQAREAGAALGEARAILATKSPDPGTGRAFSAADWHAWVSGQALCREAGSLLEKKSKK
jgi:eukaryotic-like serine/threonine-protein kinase